MISTPVIQSLNASEPQSLTDGYSSAVCGMAFGCAYSIREIPAHVQARNFCNLLFNLFTSATYKSLILNHFDRRIAHKACVNNCAHLSWNAEQNLI